MIAVSVDRVAKMYGGNVIFEDISFEIEENEKIGLVGRNGSGKTTLIRLLAAKEKPDSGQLHWKKDTTIGYLEQIPEYDDKTTAKDILKSAFNSLLNTERKMKALEWQMEIENDARMLEQLVSEYGCLQDQFAVNGGYEMEAKVSRIAQGLNIQPLLEQKLMRLSGGEKTKVCLGLILLQQPDLLLLDEPTNHLDLMAVEWLGDFLRNYGGTVLIISHDRYFLDEVVNKVIDLEDGEANAYHTNYSGFVKEKEAKLLREFQAYEEQQKKIKKMKEAIKRLRDWANRANPPNAGLHRRARNMERALERIQKLQRPLLNQRRIEFELDAADRSGKDVILLADVSKSYSDKLLFERANMQIIYRDRAVIIGENGTGKSTLLKLILQQLEPDSGEVRIGSNVKVGYLSQHVFSAITDETVISAFRETASVSEGEARNILAKFMFYGYAVFKKVSQLSGGERMRLRLAQLMHQDINLLVLDEPTNHLDIESREVLEEALEDFQGTILAVSHDRYFLNKLFSKIYWLEAKQIHCFEGDYTWAKKKMGEVRDRLTQKNDQKNASRISVQEKTLRKIETNKTKEEDLLLLEEKILQIDRDLSITEDLESLQKLFMEKEEMEKEWEELCNRLV